MPNPSAKPTPNRGPMTHRLKCWPDQFQATADGRKPFELRRDDRNYRVGDTLELWEYRPENRRFTGRRLAAVVSYKTPGGNFGLPVRLCVLGLHNVMALGTVEGEEP